MRLGVFSVLYSQLPFEQALDKFKGLGLDAVEVGCGNYPGDAHCKPAELLADPVGAAAFRKAVESRDMIIRTATEADLPAILAIYNEVISSSTAIYFDEELWRIQPKIRTNRR